MKEAMTRCGPNRLKDKAHKLDHNGFGKIQLNLFVFFSARFGYCLNRYRNVIIEILE